MRRKIAAVAAAIAAAIWPLLAIFQIALKYGPDLIGLPGMVADAEVWRDQWIPWLIQTTEELVHSPGIWLLSITGIIILAAIAWPEIRSTFRHRESQMQNAHPKELISAADTPDIAMSLYKPESSPADHDAWAEVNEFHLWEAACLWVGIEPTYPPPDGRPTVSLRNLKMAICTRKLKFQTTSLTSMRLVAAWTIGSIPSINDVWDNTIVTRAQLLSYAKTIGERPRFLSGGG